MCILLHEDRKFLLSMTVLRVFHLMLRDVRHAVAIYRGTSAIRLCLAYG